MSTPNLHELVAARICHDLISPVGACVNGAELLSLGGGAEETALIAQSAQDASAKLQLLRVTFGPAARGQTIGSAEVKAMLSLQARERVKLLWHIDDTIQRTEAKAAFISVLCLQAALPRGGEIGISKNAEVFEIIAEGPDLQIDEDLWGPLTKGQAPEDLQASTVQFGLLPDLVSGMGRTIRIHLEERRIRIVF
ncbi:histidine phosphotransferase family protein [Cognatishimia maritima]|uniref:Histidine phosphotransferase ChpT n=1 Tax=Cognatishimia maritima TaxID=870908 RepID=A0A1M5IGD5_9RHOB|nr:histidine phosphotransferase family protein [Cognatishimia maritima]SHG27444.1 histidine phosphotransferase ChpT [Cognatishimia maritima]